MSDEKVVTVSFSMMSNEELQDAIDQTIKIWGGLLRGDMMDFIGRHAMILLEIQKKRAEMCFIEKASK